METKDIFIAKARKYNNYQECDRTEGRKCINCTRWRLSYPYTCNDYNYPLYGTPNKAETCLNWTDEKRPEVD